MGSSINTNETMQAAHLAAIVESSDDAIISKTLDGTIASWNGGAERIFGYRAAEAIGQSIRLIIPDELQQEELAILAHIRRGERVAHFDTTRIAKGGQRIAISLTVSPLRNTSGAVIGASKIARDITAQQLAKEQAEVSEERFRLLANATNDIIWDWDMQSNLIWWNDGVSSILGYPPEKFRSGPEAWLKIVHPEDQERVVAGLGTFVAGSEQARTDEYRLVKANGKIATILERSYILRDQSEHAVRMLGSMMDVTERREFDAKMRQSQKTEALGQLTGGVAHDFNNLLTVILGNASVLVESLPAATPLHALAMMTATAAERAAELTARLVAFARRQPLEPKAVNIDKLLAGMAGLLRRTLSEDIDIKFIEGDGVANAHVDQGQLETALLNLTINARDAMPSGGCITFETGLAVLDEKYASEHEEVTPGTYVMIAVSDTGIGMSRETASKAFEPFFTTKGPGQGSGLGLSMVYGFIKQSVGHIKIYSELNQGTCFKIYLPISVGNEQVIETILQKDTVGGHERILVVEDNALVRDHVVLQLRQLGYHVIAAVNGIDALTRLRNNDDIDLLFTDDVMPGGMSGLELAREALKINPNMPILFTSGYTENAIIHQGRLDPGVLLLSKPYRRQDLALKIREALS